MKVLLTGAFGNIGRSTLDALLAQGQTVRCFDLRTQASKRVARRYVGQIEVIWGDLRRSEDLAAAVEGQDVVLHLAFIIPKMSATGIESEDRPDWAREVNVEGTRNLIEAIQAQPCPPRLIFASSYHVFGRTQDCPPPRTVADPVQPIEHYAHHKVECEEMVRTSGLEWAILRLSATLPLAIQLDPGMFDVPLDNRMEFAHTRDVGLAFANAARSEAIWGKTLLIGGGPRCQIYYREIVERVLGAMGVGMLPEEAFSEVPFATDWVDSSESQRLLAYQQRDFGDYTEDMVRLAGFRRHLIHLFRSIVRRYLLRQSLYYQAAKSRRISADWGDRVAIVTGASSGIGAETAKNLALHGLTVVLVARREEQLANLASEICDLGGKAEIIVADLADEEECLRVYHHVRSIYGGADVVINSAGLGWYGFGINMPWSLARQMLQINVSAVVRLTLLFLDDMKEKGRGHIINVGSVVGSLPSQGVALYGATKSFIDSFTTALYRELRGTNVRISVIRPGAVATEMFKKAVAYSGALRMPVERFTVKPRAVAERIWKLLRKPARVAYVPGVLEFVPWIEPAFGWLIDRLGPLLLKRQSRHATSSLEA